jgi:glycogen debranching enzyme
MLNRRTFLRWSLSWPLATPFLGPLPIAQASRDAQARRDDTLTKGRPTDVESLAHAIVMKKDEVFFVARPDGNVAMTGNHGMGLYYHDCRYLNGYELTIAGRAAAPLSASAAQGAIGVFTMTNPEITLPDGTTLATEELGITWHRLLDGAQPALRDELHIQNFTLRDVEFSVTLAFRAAFEDLYAVRGLADQPRGQRQQPRWHDGVLEFRYAGKDGVMRALSVHCEPPADERHETAATFHVALPAREQRTIRLSLVIHESNKSAPAAHRSTHLSSFRQLESDLEGQRRRWMAEITKVSGNGSALDQLLERAFRSLRVLRAHLGQDAYFAAGVPWFVTLFGRDSAVTALQMLAYHPGIAEQTLRLLAHYQGKREDDWRDEQPGKILHELRVGELANLNAIPQTPFYGTVDATPLFLLLVAQHAAWTGSLGVFHDLRPHIDLALQWLDTYGDRHATGYVSYDSSTAGDKMVNKGWPGRPLRWRRCRATCTRRAAGWRTSSRAPANRTRPRRYGGRHTRYAHGSIKIFGWKTRDAMPSRCRKTAGRPPSCPPMRDTHCGPASRRRTRPAERSSG